MRSVESYIRDVAPLVGMEEPEIQDLVALCEGLDGYYSYEQLRTISEQLADSHDHVWTDVIGRSSDYWDTRPISRTVIGDPEDGERAYLQGPEHASEMAGATTTAVIERLFARHPRLLRRLGYGALAATSHIDPDGMELQAWPLSGATLKQVVKYGYRGAWSDQVSWGYPSAGYRRVLPEVEASLSTVEKYEPRFVGSMHASHFAGYVVSSSANQAMAVESAEALEKSGLPINYDQPESPNDPILAPGVFGTATSDSYKAARHDEDGASDNIHDGGTNISEHLPSGSTLIIPEVPSIIADPADDFVTDVTTDQVIAYGAQKSLTATERVTQGIKRLSYKPGVQTPEFYRLHRAAQWWGETMPAVFEGQIAEAPSGGNGELVTRSQRAQRIGTHLVNSLMYAGNVQRLATMTGDWDVAEDMERTIDDGLDVIGPTRRVEIGRQIAVQVLTVLIGMKHAN